MTSGNQSHGPVAIPAQGCLHDRKTHINCTDFERSIEWFLVDRSRCGEWFLRNCSRQNGSRVSCLGRCLRLGNRRPRRRLDQVVAGEHAFDAPNAISTTYLASGMLNSLYYLNDDPANRPANEENPVHFHQRVYSILLFGVLTLNVQAIEPPAYVQKQDVVFGESHGTGLLMDVFEPTTKSNGLAIIDVASGSWYSDRGKIRDHTHRLN